MKKKIEVDAWFYYALLTVTAIDIITFWVKNLFFVGK